MKTGTIPSLLAPAGNRRAFLTAVRFGADAVYCGFRQHSLRAKAANFTADDLAELIRFAHEKGVKVHLTLNSFMMEGDAEGMLEDAKTASEIGADALIISDPGLASIVHRALPEMPIHISTQANITNSAAALLWNAIGATRVVLSRELTLAQIARIAGELKGRMEVETFVHGSVCMAWSGRCFLSKCLTGRSANQGACTQPCRWTYEITESGKPANRLSVNERPGATEILSANDLCLIGHLDELAQAGIACLKVEGRTKSEYYVATVIGAYRRALDALKLEDGTRAAEVLAECRTELDKISHRPYDTGFYFETNALSEQQPVQADEKEYIAYVLERRGSSVLLEVKNRFYVGDELETVTPAGSRAFTVEDIVLEEEGEHAGCVLAPQKRVLIPCSVPLEAGDLLRGIIRNRAGTKPAGG